MSKKKQTIVLSVIGAATILVLMVGVTFAYFTSTMSGEAANTNVSTKLIGGISFTAQAVDGSEILPGWTSGAKTVTVTAEASDVDMEYSCTLNITENGLTDLKLTLSGDNYVTENNNATLGTTAVTIARGTIPAREEVATKTMTYTISLPETGENQTEGNSGKNFAATVSCKLDNEIRYYEGSNNVVATNFYDKLLADNPTRLASRTDFDNYFTDSNVGTLYTQSGNFTEDVNGDGTGELVYYFAGGAQNNWVKFGKAEVTSCTFDGYAVGYGNLTTGVIKTTALTEDECKSTNICKAYKYNEVYNRNDLQFLAVGIPENYCNEATLSSFVGDGLTYDYSDDVATYNNSVDDLYWRIIRTNEDGGVRLLYNGTSPDTTNAYVFESFFNGTINSEDSETFVGYMYGTEGSLANIRTNTNSSVIKNNIDTWYNSELNTRTDGTYTYDSYISKTAIYCNDRSTDAWYGITSDNNDTYFGPHNRLYTYGAKPSYRCGNTINGTLYSNADVADKFSVSESSGGNGDLTYPIALITADEIVYAGGITAYDDIDYRTSTFPWYSTNSNGENVINDTWWTMSPSYINNFEENSLHYVTIYSLSNGGNGDNYTYLANTIIEGGTSPVRPVLSLKSCALTTGGNGSSTSPYEISIDASCAASEN